MDEKERLEELKDRKESAEWDLAHRRENLEEAQAAFDNSVAECDKARREYEDLQDVIEALNASSATT